MTPDKLNIVITKEEQDAVFEIIMRDGVDAGIDAARQILNDKFIRGLLEEGILNVESTTTKDGEQDALN